MYGCKLKVDELFRDCKLAFVRGKPASILLNRGCIGQRPDRPRDCSVEVR
jgi:hypothetical protein